MKICVYCSSHENLDPEYYDVAEKFGRAMVKRGHSLVYGGYNKGIMAAVARGVAAEHGEIIAVVPKIFDRPDFTFEGCTKVIMTATMSERKAAMENECDAFAILPGGIGTFDELFEAIVLKSLGLLDKPMAVLNIRGCYDLLKQMLEKNMEDGFLKPENYKLIDFCTDPDAVLDLLEK